MISCISFENAHLFNAPLTSQFKLRHKCFIERQDYNVFTYNGMEYDQYDNPSSVYLVAHSEDGKALGTSRLTPVSHRSMLKDLALDMVDDHSVFSRPNIWEGTRFCVDKDLPPNVRDRVTKELVFAYYEFGLKNNVAQIIGMMPTYIWKRVLQSNGCKCEILGPIKIIDGQKIQAVSLDINSETFRAVQEKTKLNQSGVIWYGEELTRAA